jgi:IPT/TIG domain
MTVARTGIVLDFLLRPLFREVLERNESLMIAVDKASFRQMIRLHVARPKLLLVFWLLLCTSALFPQSGTVHHFPYTTNQLHNKLAAAATSIPITSSRVYWFVISTNGYGSAPISMILPTANGAETDDSGNSYVTTDANGNFSISAWSACPATNSFQYVLSIGGTDGTTQPNPYLAMVAIVPVTCGNNWSVHVSEPETVAAAFGLATFATVYTNSFATDAASVQALQAGVAYANTLVNSSTGQYAGNPWTATLNTFANMLAACNTSSDGTQCSSLFSVTGTRGGPPANTFQAMLNIALNPSLDLSIPYRAISPTAPYQPFLTSIPTSWILPSSGSLITAISPDPAPPGALVTIAGTGFGATQGSGVVSIGGVQATISSWTDTSIVAEVPSGSSSEGAVQVFASDSSSSSTPFFEGAIIAPVIESLSLTQGPATMGFQITGTDFGDVQGLSSISLGGTPLQVISWTNQVVTVQIPSAIALGPQNVFVTVGGVPSNAAAFTVLNPMLCSL